MNPSDKECWAACPSCLRCADKGRFAKCSSCSGHHDPLERWDPFDIDDKCRCREGVLNYKTSKGRRIIAKFPNNPYGGNVRADEITSDERDWNSYLLQRQERLGDESYSPVQFEDGSSTDVWVDQHRLGTNNK